MSYLRAATFHGKSGNPRNPPARSDLNAKPISTALVSESLGVPGTAELGQMLHGHALAAAVVKVAGEDAATGEVVLPAVLEDVTL